MDLNSTTIKSSIPGWLSENEIKNLTGFKTTKLWQLRTQGSIVSSKIGRKTYYSLESLLDLLAKNSQ